MEISKEILQEVDDIVRDAIETDYLAASDGLLVNVVGERIEADIHHDLDSELDTVCGCEACKRFPVRSRLLREGRISSV